MRLPDLHMQRGDRTFCPVPVFAPRGAAGHILYRAQPRTKGRNDMIPVNKLVDVFYTMLGWPYASPGTNGPAGIDCSGAFA